MLTLNCYVLGTDPDTFFQVTVDPDDIVYALRAAIMTRWFQDTRISVSTFSVALWATSIPLNKALKETAEDVARGEPLKYFQVISDIFPPTECRRSSAVHVVADLPPFILKLRCFVLGDTRDKLFTVEIHRTKTVEALQDAIVAEWSKIDRAPVHESDVTLWAASMLSNENLKEQAEDLARGESLDPSKLLSDVFPSTEFGCGSAVHVVADLPPFILKLRCFVLGDTRGKLFTVEIRRTETVEALQDAIVAEWSKIDRTPVDESDVALWAASMLPNENLKEQAEELARGESLDPSKLLSDVFPSTDFGRGSTVDVVADLPPSILSLCCLAQGGNHNDAFTVEIGRTGSVNALINAIREKMLSPAPKSSLILWLVSVPIDESLAESLQQLSLLDDRDDSAVHTDNERIRPILSSGLVLSSIIKKPLEKNHVHIIFKLPPSTITQITKVEPQDDIIKELYTRYDETNRSELSGKSPSAMARLEGYRDHQAKTPFYDGRWKKEAPLDTTASPIQLFQPIFSHFLDDLSSDSPMPPEIVRATVRYMQDASAMYANEKKRRKKLNPRLSEILSSDIPASVNADRTPPDGTIPQRAAHISEPVMVLLTEEKNEIGTGDSDPSIQAGLSAARYWAQSEVDRHDVVRKNSCCPTFLLAVAGPWLAVLGAIFTGRWVIQHLTDFVWVGLDATLSEPHCFRVARIMHSLKRGVERLTEYYRDLQVTSVGPPELTPRFLPAIRAYRNENGEVVEFQYAKPLEVEPICVAFLARTTTNPPRNIVVKFVSRYGEGAHRLLASKNLAPQLFYVGPLGVLDGDPSYQHLRMVVMEYLEGQSLHQLHCAFRITAALEIQVSDRIGYALRILHEQGYVFGDLRRPNVMITTDQEVKLIDFDWAGEHDKTTYPLLLSTEVAWPAGVKGLSVMKKEHDDDMLTRLLD